jgi:SAM-dependent methyltransferase
VDCRGAVAEPEGAPEVVQTPYDEIPDFGRLYDAVPAYAGRSDTAFYMEEAARAKGPVLEIGCGTGRVLIPTARAGAQIAGIDSSRAMLDRCREKLGAEAEAIRKRVALHEADARAFSLRRKFALITAPFRSFQHSIMMDDQLAFLNSVAKHLAPGGRFVFDVFNPHLGALTKDRSAEADDTPESPVGDGRSLRRTARVPRVRFVDQVSEVELIYYVSDGPGQPEKRFVQAFEMRWFSRDELVHLLARAGMRVVATFGNFDRSWLTDASPEIVMVAEAS